MIAKNELLKKYNISEDEFEVADIKWEELEYIYKDFSEKRSSYEQKLAEFQKEFLILRDNINIPLTKEKKEAFTNFLDTLYYYLKFRKTDAQAIELMLLGFDAGRIIAGK